jgi:hypothetical protein
MLRSSLLQTALIPLWLGLACVCVFPSPADAQIYSWHDAGGRLVLSDRPSDSVERTFAVRESSTVRATRAVQAAGNAAYDELIDEQARANAVRTDLVRAVVQVESAFNPYATSPKGAMGLMQLMPATAQHYGVTNAFNPAENVRAGVAYLRELLDRYDNNEQLALAAYNAGPGAVDRHGQNVPPYAETRQYVDRVRGLAGTTHLPQQRGGTIYRSTDLVDGREIPKYSDTKPTDSYEVVGGWRTPPRH